MTQAFTTVTAWLASGRPPGTTIAPTRNAPAGSRICWQIDGPIEHSDTQSITIKDELSKFLK